MGIFSSIVKGAASAAKMFGGPVGNIVGGVVGDVIDKKEAQDKFNQEAQFKLSTMREQNAFNQAEAEKARSFNAAEAEKARLFNQAEAEKARQFNHDAAIEMFNLENAYNTPAAQMQRMRAAGLNPALMTGQQPVAASGTAPSSSPASSPAASGSFASAGSGLSAPVLMNPNRTDELALNALQAKKLSAEIESIEDANQRENEKQPYVIETMKGNIYLIGTNVELNKTTKQSLEAQMPLYQSELEQINETIQSVKLDNDKRRKVLANWQREFDTNMANLEADTGYKISLTAKSRAEVNKIFSETTAINQQNVINSIEFEVAKNNHAALVQLRYNKEKQEYDVYIENAEAGKAEARSRKAKAEADSSYYDFINGDSWMGAFHEGLYDFSRSIGLSAGFSIKK